MRRWLLVAGLVLGALSWLGAAPTASAAPQAPAGDDSECFPGGPSGYPPTTLGAEIDPNLVLGAGSFEVGATGTIQVTGAVPNVIYCGQLFSTLVVLSETQADGAGVLTFDIPNVPDDFELNAFHHLDVFREGRLVGAFDFCVNDEGDNSGIIVGPDGCDDDVLPRGPDPDGNGDGDGNRNRSLARTGLDYLDDLLRIAAVLIGVGALFVYERRRRRAQAA